MSEKCGEDVGLRVLGANEAPKICLDTLGACFLCLNVPEGIASSSEFSNKSLREVLRYLEVSGLKKKIREGANPAEENIDGDSHKREECDIEVRLCKNCATETTNLSYLIDVFQQIQTEINDGLQNIHEILQRSNTEAGIQQLAKIRNASRIEGCLVQELRAETDRKCIEKLNAMPPPAKEISNVPEPVATTSTSVLTTTDRATAAFTGPVSMPLPSTPTSCMQGMLISTNPLNGEQSMSSASTQPRQKIRQPSNEESLQMFAKHFQYQLQNGKKITKCLLCNTVFQQNTNIRLHLVAKHLEFLFPKMPAANGKVFEETLSDVLWSEIKCNAGSGKSNKDGVLAFNCGICKRDFLQKKGCRYHLVVQHYPELVAKLKMSLGGETSERMSNGTAGEGEENEGSIKGGLQSHTCAERRGKYKCTIWSGGCGRSFSNLQTLQIHQHSCQKKKRREASTSSTSSLQGGGVGKPLLTTSINAMKPQQTECPTVKAEVGQSGWTSGVGDGHQDQMDDSSDETPVENVHQSVESSYGANEMGEAEGNDTSDIEMGEYIDVVTCSGDESD